MTQTFRMDKPQPRLLDETRQGVIGTPMDRPDGPLKVSGQATYTADALPEGCVHGMLVRATVTRGHLRDIDRDSIADIPGLLAVVRDPRFLRNPAQGMAGEAPDQPGDRIDYHGQPVALVVAETFEAARDGALRLKLRFDSVAAEVDPDHATEVEPQDPTESGDWDAAWSGAAHQVDVVYTTPCHASAAMEPHAAVAEWQGDRLILRGALQMLRFNRKELADAVGIPPEQVQILAPYVGGGFGSKLGIGTEAVAAALAARELGRPVRVVMARQTVFDAVLRRTETRQHLQLAADAEGHLLALGHDDRVSNLPGEEFAEPVSSASQFLYGARATRFRQDMVRVHRVGSGSVRAPGEAVGVIAIEAAMDELADALGMCPVELRLRNLPDQHPVTGQPFSARGLVDCLREGAKSFGWSDRQAPGARQEGDWLIGMGMASAARPNMLVKSAARVRLSAEGAVVETDMTDIGTGTYAVLTQVAAEMLGLPPGQVTVKLGDTDLPGASGSGGSFGASSSGSAVFLAAKKIRDRLAAKLGCAPEDLSLQDGLARGANLEAPINDLLAGDVFVEEAEIKGGKTAESHFSAGFGAHFCEVAVHRWTGEVRLRRMHGTFAMGRVLNEKTARSQAVGGMIWGVGSALHEDMSHDPRTGHVVTRDLANYHIAAHADIPRDMQVVFLEERDDFANPLQSKGVGELGISGAGGAVLNAIHNACGVRIRDIPATPDRVIAALEAAGR
ncbi:xanthine dehydrogenase family protein molybdopterin-binding subunit [Salipiger marinus]|uniref:xanthine dehydrogenase family protein molybdopterin-binding subunit n=1 Tax=Salipiger marinus TaxID=555512 RepID=UPI001E64076A|nr:xanthine dehydrogenase family protein molybdopterin-binding subunit [Salipiger manganoxidans]MCD1617834.1 xanthine dehydrogenase family protein molybdopterin-binding subunit [Salipiger manganoxidans]MEB3418367.1 xanthine dehydrogenase family protein molybdopterin-binding subunit [Salipiger manganoxidans]